MQFIVSTKNFLRNFLYTVITNFVFFNTVDSRCKIVLVHITQRDKRKLQTSCVKKGEKILFSRIVFEKAQNS